MAELFIEPPEIGATFLNVVATIRNGSPDTPFSMSSEPSSFRITGGVGEIPWQFVGPSDAPDDVLVGPTQVYTWATLIPITRSFEGLGPDHPGFVELPAGQYRLQLVCALDWLLPTGSYSPDQRAAVLADQFTPSLSSNVVRFELV
ncbi:hypothetical protein ACXR0O_25470 [Verrucomicrobiota bacterium sgz303538]